MKSLGQYTASGQTSEPNTKSRFWSKKNLNFEAKKDTRGNFGRWIRILGSRNGIRAKFEKSILKLILKI